MENIEVIREQIEELEKKIAEIEDQAREKEVLAREQLDAEYKPQFEKIQEKSLSTNKSLELALKRFEGLKAKQDDLKYKVKETGRGKELLAEINETIKGEKSRVDDLKSFAKGYPDYIKDLEKEKTKKLNTIIKEITNEKKNAVKVINTDIKSLNKEISALQKL